MNLRSQILYSQYQAEYVPQNEIPDFVGVVPVGLPIVDTETSETLMPINPITGYRDGDLKRLFDPTVSKTEKEYIMSTLQSLASSNANQGLSDEDILTMIPSRYMSDPVEINRYLDELKEIRDSLLTPSDPEPTPSDPEPTPSDPEL